MNAEELFKNLNEIGNILTSVEIQKFLRNFKPWKQGREDSISTLGKLEAELNDIKFKSDVGRTITAGVSIVGGITAAIGFFLSMSGNESRRSTGDKMIKGGTATGLAGGAASLSIAAAEFVINKNVVDAVNTALRKDYELTNELLPFIERSQKLDLLFNEIFDCSITSDTMQDIRITFENIQIICEEGKQTYKDISGILSESFSDFTKTITFNNKDAALIRVEKSMQNLSFKVKLLLREFCDNPNVRNAVSKIFNSCKRSSVAFEFMKCAMNFTIQMRILEKTGMFITLMTFANTAVSHTAYNAQLLVFQLIKIAIDISGIIVTAKDIDKNTSKYSKMVKEVTILLSNELRYMNRVYSSINERR